jgi:3-hydroxyisobutyrate dehydrogenase
MATADQIGFIGIGNMGGPMAANLLKAGFDVTVYDTNSERCIAFARRHGCAGAGSLAELGKAADIVITMLPTGPIVRGVLLEEDGGALSGLLARGSLVVDMSSSEPVGTQELAAVLAEKGITLIDAPVSGGVTGAVKGTLSIMIGGGDEDAVARVMPLFEAMGGNMFRTGPAGSGHATKALNNFMAATNYAVACEAVILGRKFGLDPQLLSEIIKVSSGRNLSIERSIPAQALTGKFAAGFTIGLMAKDVKITSDMADDLDADAPLSRFISARWEKARDALGVDADFTAAYKFWSDENGL